MRCQKAVVASHIQSNVLQTQHINLIFKILLQSFLDKAPSHDA
jgi:hypothetical protein